MVITEIRQLFDSFSFNDWIIFTVLLVALHMFLALLKRAALACLSLSEPGRGGVSEAAISAAYSAGRGLRRQPCKLVLVVRAGEARIVATAHCFVLSLLVRLLLCIRPPHPPLFVLALIAPTLNCPPRPLPPPALPYPSPYLSSSEYLLFSLASS
eukprot:GHVU01202164.1.p3 GENE.GHVU01202164.1~~GHVU01202164.1.p3  ORF type:complete len:155 (-),score=14.61 GHVU01202164.1:2121-2585(-)